MEPHPKGINIIVLYFNLWQFFSSVQGILFGKICQERFWLALGSELYQGASEVKYMF